jgi:hypothetical protein
MVDSVAVARRRVVLANTNSKAVVLAQHSTVVVRRSSRIDRIKQRRCSVRERRSVAIGVLILARKRPLLRGLHIVHSSPDALADLIQNCLIPVSNTSNDQ